MSNFSDDRSIHTRDSVDRVNVTHGVPTDRVRWGPVLAGAFAAMTTLAILSVLGAAIGLSSYDRGYDDARNFAMAGGIWGIASTILAFGFGGWVAARSSAIRGRDNGFLNGGLVAAVGIPLILYLVGSAATTMSSAEIANNRDTQARTQTDAAITSGSVATDNTMTANRSGDNEQGQRDASKTAWSTLIGMVLAVAAAGMAGYMGARNDDRNDHLRSTTSLGDRMTPAHA